MVLSPRKFFYIPALSCSERIRLCAPAPSIKLWQNFNLGVIALWLMSVSGTPVNAHSTQQYPFLCFFFPFLFKDEPLKAFNGRVPRVDNRKLLNHHCERKRWTSKESSRETIKRLRNKAIKCSALLPHQKLGYTIKGATDENFCRCLG